MPPLLWAGVVGVAHKAEPAWSYFPVNSTFKPYVDVDLVNDELAKLKEALKNTQALLIATTSLLGEMEASTEFGLPYRFKQLKCDVDLGLVENAEFLK